MGEPTGEDVAPLGEPTPARAGTGPRSQRSTAAIAAAALGLGLLLGFVFGLALTQGDGVEEDAAQPVAGTEDARGSTTADLPTSTTVVPLALECLETIRSAEQALELLNQGLQSLRQLDPGDLDEVLADMQRLRDRFRLRIEECLEVSATDPDPGGTTTGEDGA